MGPEQLAQIVDAWESEEMRIEDERRLSNGDRTDRTDITSSTPSPTANASGAGTTASEHHPDARG